MGATPTQTANQSEFKSAWQTTSTGWKRPLVQIQQLRPITQELSQLVDTTPRKGEAAGSSPAFLTNQQSVSQQQTTRFGSERKLGQHQPL